MANVCSGLFDTKRTWCGLHALVSNTDRYDACSRKVERRRGTLLLNHRVQIVRFHRYAKTASGILTSAAEVTFKIPHTSRSTDYRCVVLLSQAYDIFLTGSVQSSLVFLTKAKASISQCQAMQYRL